MEADNTNSYTYHQYLRNKRILKNIQIFLGLMYIGCLVWFGITLSRREFDPTMTVAISLTFFVVLAVIKSMHKQNTHDQSHNYLTWGRGAAAEKYVLQDLQNLPAEYRHITDFQNGHGNIDAILIGPRGIFTIEVKAMKGTVSYHDGQILVNGRSIQQDCIKQTYAEAQWVAEALKKQFGKHYDVTGILEFPFGKIDTATIHGPINSVWIGGRRFHEYIINNSHVRLSSDEVDGIYSFLDTKTNIQSK